MNLPRLLDALEAQGIENPIVCANINKLGFRMCGGIEAYERTIENRRFRAVAMSVFGSGAISPEEALEYVTRQGQIKSIVFGASSIENIRRTKGIIERFDRTKLISDFNSKQVDVLWLGPTTGRYVRFQRLLSVEALPPKARLNMTPDL